MIYLPNTQTLYLHVPKTGGSTLLACIKELCVYEEVSPRHGDLHAAIHWKGAANVKHVFSVMRHPADWLESYWCDRMRVGWGGDLAIAHDCCSPSFNVFSRNVVRKHPGLVTEVYQRYISRASLNIRYPDIILGLIRVLKTIGETCDLWKLESVRSENRSLPDLKHRLRWDEKIYDRFCQVERQGIALWEQAQY